MNDKAKQMKSNIISSNLFCFSFGINIWYTFFANQQTTNPLQIIYEMLILKINE